MTLKKHIYGVLCASLIINYFTAPVAAPLIWHDVKQATSDRLIEMASNLRPESPTVVPAVKVADMMDEEWPKQKAMPPRKDVGKLAQAMPTERVDIIAKLLEAN